MATAPSSPEVFTAQAPPARSQTPRSQWHLVSTPGPARLRVSHQGILSPSYRGEAVAQRGKSLARRHKAGEGWEWSLNPSLLASEAQFSHSLPPLESGICIPIPCWPEPSSREGQRLTRGFGVCVTSSKACLLWIRDFQILTLAV